MVTRIDWRLRKNKEGIKTRLCLPFLILVIAPCAAGLFWLLVEWQSSTSGYLEGKTGLIWIVLPIIFLWSLLTGLKGLLQRRRLKRELAELEEDERLGRRHDRS